MRGQHSTGGTSPQERSAAQREEEEFAAAIVTPRKAERERLAGSGGRGVPAGIIRNPINLPPMRNIKDGEAPFDSDEDYEVDELLGDELAKVEEQLG